MTTVSSADAESTRIIRERLLAANAITRTNAKRKLDDAENKRLALLDLLATFKSQLDNVNDIKDKTIADLARTTMELMITKITKLVNITTADTETIRTKYNILCAELSDYERQIHELYAQV